MRILRLIVLCLSIVLLALSTLLGLLSNYLFLFLLISALVMLVTCGVFVTRRKSNRSGGPVQAGSIAHTLRRMLRSAAWIVMGVCVHTAIAPVQFPPDTYRFTIFLLWGAVIALCLLDWFPRRPGGRALDITLSLFTVFLVYQLVVIYWLDKRMDGIALHSPFKEDWVILQGGGSALTNHHHFAGSQKYAIDSILPEDGPLPLNNVTDLGKYASFGRSLYSPIDGEIVATQDSLPDQPVGESDRNNIAGNHIVIKTEQGVFLLLAHLQQESVLIARGDRIAAGQEIAKVGNSGNTSQPHLHIQAMTGADFTNADNQPVPMLFDVSSKPSALKRNVILPGMAG